MQRFVPIGVMWVRLGDNVTMRAAAFWSFCNLDNWPPEGDYAKVRYQNQVVKKFKAWTIFSVAERDRYLRINPMLRNWYLTDLEILEIWDDIVKLESKITPRLRQVWDRLMVCPETRDWLDIYFTELSFWAKNKEFALCKIQLQRVGVYPSLNIIHASFKAMDSRLSINLIWFKRNHELDIIRIDVITDTMT